METHRSTNEGRQALFPKGKPTDPTEKMTPDQKARWGAMNEQYSNHFKMAKRFDRSFIKYNFVVRFESTDVAIKIPISWARGAIVGLTINRQTFVAYGDKSTKVIGPFWLDVTDTHPKALYMLGYDYDEDTMSRLGYTAEQRDLLRDTVGDWIQDFRPREKKRWGATIPLDLTPEGLRVGRFQEGIPVDPTQNMSPEDKEKWDAMNQEHGDKFKAESQGKQARRIPKGNFALVKAQGMDDQVISVHQTREQAEAAMRKKGGEPDSMFTKGMRIVDVGPQGRYEVIEVFNKLTVRSKTAAKAACGCGGPDPEDELLETEFDVLMDEVRGADPDLALLTDEFDLIEASVVASEKKATDVAETILEQMGGKGRLRAMLGVQQFIRLTNGHPGVGIRWPNKQRSKGNYVEIRLTPADLYDVEFFNVSIKDKKSVKKVRGVYADQLGDIFYKQTGWALRLACGCGDMPEPEETVDDLMASFDKYTRLGDDFLALEEMGLEDELLAVLDDEVLKAAAALAKVPDEPDANGNTKKRATPTVKEALLSKRAGYSYYWSYSARAGAQGADISPYISEGTIQKAQQLVRVTSELEKAYQEQLKGGRPDHNPVRLPGTGDMTLDHFVDDLISNLEGAQQELRDGNLPKEATLADRLAGTLEKFRETLKKKKDTYYRHHRSYKGKPEVANRAFEAVVKAWKQMWPQVVKGLGALLRVPAPDISNFGFTDQEWAKVLAAAKSIVAAASKQMVIRGGDGTGKPILDGNKISLNGDDANGEAFETFYLEKTPRNPKFNFCKTGQEPYDAVVVSILAAAKKIAPDAINVSADGGGSAIKRIYASDKAAWGGRYRGRSQSNDPRWLKARRPGVDQNGNAFNRGADILWYPLTKTILTGKEADKAWRDFESAAADEEFMRYAYQQNRQHHEPRGVQAWLDFDEKTAGGWWDTEKEGKTPAGAQLPNSKWDRFPREQRPFRWSTPAPLMDGSFPEPWRVTDKDAALVFLKRLFPKYNDIYTDNMGGSKYKGFEQIWVGLRDNRDRSLWQARLEDMAKTLRGKGFPARLRGDTLYLVDDIKRDHFR